MNFKEFLEEGKLPTKTKEYFNWEKEMMKTGTDTVINYNEKEATAYKNSSDMKKGANHMGKFDVKMNKVMGK